MTDSALIAAFIASNGVTRCATGDRALTPSQIRAATGYERDEIVTRTFVFHLIGEDGVEWNESVKAVSRKVAAEIIESDFPESQIVGVNY